MKKIVYSEHGSSRVLRLIECPIPDPLPDEVRVRIMVSGVNPTDWKGRERSRGGASPAGALTPHHDGAGVIDAVGIGVTAFAAGDRVWIHAAANRRQEGTAQEYVVLPQRLIAPLPHGASFSDGAALGVPALTAHRALTVHEDAPDQLAPGALAGKNILVAGGAGAVGHAAIQLSRWAGARVASTVSSDAKADLARAAGAHAIIDYRAPDAARRIRDFAPEGIHMVVEVAPAHNASMNDSVLAQGGTIAIYANQGGGSVQLDLSASLSRNARYQFISVFLMPAEATAAGVAAIGRALADGALRVGIAAGLRTVHFPLERTAAAQDAVQAGTIGKVLVDVASAEAAAEVAAQ